MTTTLPRKKHMANEAVLPLSPQLLLLHPCVVNGCVYVYKTALRNNSNIYSHRDSHCTLSLLCCIFDFICVIVHVSCRQIPNIAFFSCCSPLFLRCHLLLPPLALVRCSLSCDTIKLRSSCAVVLFARQVFFPPGSP